MAVLLAAMGPTAVVLLRATFGDNAARPLFNLLQVGSLALGAPERLCIAETVHEISRSKEGSFR